MTLYQNTYGASISAPHNNQEIQVYPANLRVKILPIYQELYLN